MLPSALRLSTAALLLFAAVAGCGEARDCGEYEYSAGFERIGVLRSDDAGATWSALPDACFQAPELLPVDPSPIADGAGLAVYFLDLLTLGRDDTPRQIYRSASRDGATWTEPQPVFAFGEDITDPFVLRLADGSYRLYLQHPGSRDIVSAWSPNGAAFSFEPGVRTAAGAIPGALLLPDGRVRLFVAGDPRGITSLISSDGLTFMAEEGVRVPATGFRTTNPHPTPLSAGGYLMVYDVQPRADADYPDEQARLSSIEIRLARSADGLNWTVDPAPVGLGNVPGIVEIADGALLVVYVDASHRRAG